MTTSARRRFSLGSFIFGLALGVLLIQLWAGGFLSFSSETSSDETMPVASSTPAHHSADTSGAVSVADQPAGSSVTIESVTVPPPGVWIAVREINSGALGNILGAARAKGPRMNVIVPLLRNTVSGTQYAIELYRDDGTDIFKTSDSVYVDFATGQPVVTYFTTD